MSTVVEIEKALQTLPVEEARKVAGWLQSYLDDKWDKQIDGDIAAGRLDKIWEQAKADIAAGPCGRRPARPSHNGKPSI